MFHAAFKCKGKNSLKEKMQKKSLKMEFFLRGSEFGHNFLFFLSFLVFKLTEESDSKCMNDCEWEWLLG